MEAENALMRLAGGDSPDPEHVAETYLMHRPPPDQERIFEDHYMTCARCAGSVEETEEFVVAMRRAAEQLRRSPPTFRLQ